MTIESSIARDTSLPGIVFNYVANAIRAAVVRRARRIALGELFAMSPGRLQDLGIDAGDVIAALDAAPAAGATLATRRAAHADRSLGLHAAKAA